MQDCTIFLIKIVVRKQQRISYFMFSKTSGLQSSLQNAGYSLSRIPGVICKFVFIKFLNSPLHAGSSPCKSNPQISLGKTNDLPSPDGSTYPMDFAFGRNGNRKGSRESDVIGRHEGARDLQPCLARIEKKIVRKYCEKMLRYLR